MLQNFVLKNNSSTNGKGGRREAGIFLVHSFKFERDTATSKNIAIIMIINFSKPVSFLDVLYTNFTTLAKVLKFLETYPDILINLANAEKVLLRGNPSSICQLGLAPHAPYSVSPDLFRSIGQLAQQYHCPVSCHVAEIKEEGRFLVLGDDSLEGLLKERSAWDPKWQPPYKSPMQYLSSLGILDRLIAVHCNFVSDDLALMAEKKVGAVFCPQSSEWFGRTNLMPVRALLDRGITVALGTDSLASSNSLNFLDELRMADKLLPDVSRKEILAMATRGGAEALGLQCGVLAPGKKADLIGFRVSKAYSGSWWDVPFESHRREVDFYSMDENSYGFC